MCDFACKASATLSIHRKNKHNIITPRMKVSKAKTKKEKPASPPSVLPLQQQQQQQQQQQLQVRWLNSHKIRVYEGEGKIFWNICTGCGRWSCSCVVLTSIFGIPLPAPFCLGSWKCGVEQH